MQPRYSAAAMHRGRKQVGISRVQALTLFCVIVTVLTLSICYHNNFSLPVYVMTEPSAIDTVVKRLALALDALDAAIERRHEADQDVEQLAQQLQLLSLDRSNLAARLDNEAARARKLEAVNGEIAERLDSAIESIQFVL